MTIWTEKYTYTNFITEINFLASNLRPEKSLPLSSHITGEQCRELVNDFHVRIIRLYWINLMYITRIRNASYDGIESCLALSYSVFFLYNFSKIRSEQSGSVCKTSMFPIYHFSSFLLCVYSTKSFSFIFHYNYSFFLIMSNSAHRRSNKWLYQFRCGIFDDCIF